MIISYHVHLVDGILCNKKVINRSGSVIVAIKVTLCMINTMSEFDKLAEGDSHSVTKCSFNLPLSGIAKKFRCSYRVRHIELLWA